MTKDQNKMDPIVVVNNIEANSDWWVAWLPVLGSLLVAVAAVIGVYVNNATNRRAIEAADVRESDKWHRDTLLPVCVDFLGKSNEMLDTIAETVNIFEEKPVVGGEVDELIREANGALGKLNAQFTQLFYQQERLRLIADTEVREICSKIVEMHRKTKGALWQWLDSEVNAGNMQDSPMHLRRMQSLDSVLEGRLLTLGQHGVFVDAVRVEAGMRPVEKLSPPTTEVAVTAHSMVTPPDSRS